MSYSKCFVCKADNFSGNDTRITVERQTVDKETLEHTTTVWSAHVCDGCLRKLGLLGEVVGEEIVRCRDCDLSHEDELGNLRCNGPLVEPWDYYNDEPSDGVKVEPSGFCAWAVKRTGAENG